MQFKKSQRAELIRNWSSSSWFFQVSSEHIKSIIERAYGIRGCKAHEMHKCQEDVSLAVATFARSIGCEKGQATHALLSGSIKHLLAAICRKAGATTSAQEIADAWEQAFRSINQG